MAWVAYSGREPNTTRSLLHRRVPHGRACGGSDASKDQCNTMGVVARHVGANGRENRIVNASLGAGDTSVECIYIQDKRTTRDRYIVKIDNSDRTLGSGKQRWPYYDWNDAASVNSSRESTDSSSGRTGANHALGVYSDRWVYSAAQVATAYSSEQWSDFHLGDSQLRRA